jgi:hypothetical protein
VDEDLRLAVSLGFWLLPVAGEPAARVDGWVLRFDPSLTDTERSVQVCRALREKIESDPSISV